MGLEKRGKKIEIAVEGPLISNHQGVIEDAALRALGILYAYDHDRIDEAIARTTQTRAGRLIADEPRHVSLLFESPIVTIRVPALN